MLWHAPPVPGTAPDSVPQGYYAASNLVRDPSRIPFPFYRDIVSILFSPTAPVAQRQAAVDSIGGTVVGGVRLDGRDGFYLVRVPPDGQNNRVLDAADKVNGLPGVVSAEPDFVLENLTEHWSQRGLNRPSESTLVVDTSRPPLPALSNLPADTTVTVEMPGQPRAEVLYYRDVVGIVFDDTTSGTTIRALLTRYGGRIIGGVPGDSEYMVQIPDPGPTFAAAHSIVTRLHAEPGVAVVRLVSYRTPVYIH